MKSGEAGAAREPLTPYQRRLFGFLGVATFFEGYLLHAQGDESVPYTISEELHSAAGRPKRLLIFPGGHHRSLQHDGEMQAETIRFIRAAAAA